MGNASKKLNFLIEKSICQDLEELVPAGKRSKIVNEALRKELETIRRRKAVEKLLGTSSEGNKLLTHEIVEKLTEDRRSH